MDTNSFLRVALIRALSAFLIGLVAGGLAFGVLWFELGTRIALPVAGVVLAGTFVVSFFIGPRLPGIKREQSKTSQYAPFNWRQ